MEQRTYSEKFRARVVQQLLAPKGKTASELARELGVSQSTLSRWRRRATTGKVRAIMTKQPEATKRESEWGPQEKLEFLVEAMACSETDLGALLRRRGLGSRRIDRPAGATRYALWTALLAVLVFALPVGTRPRYVFPIAGLIAIAASDPIAVARQRGHRFRSLPAWRPVAWITALLGLGLFVCAWLPLDVDPLKAGRPTGWAWVPLGIAATAGAFALRRSVGGLRRDFLPFALLALAAGRHYQMVHVRPHKANETPHQDLAQRLMELREPGQGLWTHAWKEFNAQAYLQPEPRWFSGNEQAPLPPPGDLLFVDPAQVDHVVDRAHWDELILPAETMDRLRVFRRKAPWPQSEGTEQD